MLSRRWTLLTVLLALIAGSFLSFANFRLGDLNQDEGWYLLAARSVSEGKLPYRDFAFTQGPMLPMVYSLAMPLVAKFGLAGGRMFSVLLGAIAAIFASLLAGRIAPPRHAHVARAVAFALIAVNVYHSYFTAIVKTYSLCAAFLAAAFYALSFITGRRAWLAAALAGFLMAAATAARISTGAALAVTGFVLLFNRRTLSDSIWFCFGIGGALGLAAFLGPWLIVAPVGFKFGVFEYHTWRHAGGLLPALIFKAGFISRLVNGWLVAVLAVIALAAWTIAFPIIGKKRKRDFQSLETFDDDSWADPSDSMLAFLKMDVGKEITARLQKGNPVATAAWLSGAAITLVHFSAPFPYDDYQVPLFPLLAAALAASIVSALARRFDSNRIHLDAPPSPAMARASGWLLAAIFLASTFVAGSAPSNMDWFVRGRDRIWWRMKDEPALAKLHRVAKEIRAACPDAKEILTQDSYIAIETGLSVPRGMEMGPFCYFPEFSDERATENHVLNRNGMRNLLENTTAQVGAFSGYWLAIACPEVREVDSAEHEELKQVIGEKSGVEEELIRQEDAFGQGSTMLEIVKFKKKWDHQPVGSSLLNSTNPPSIGLRPEKSIETNKQ